MDKLWVKSCWKKGEIEEMDNFTITSNFIVLTLLFVTIIPFGLEFLARVYN